MEYSFFKNETINTENCQYTCGQYCKIIIFLVIFFTIYTYCFLCYKICRLKKDLEKNEEDEELLVIGNRATIHNRQPPKYEDI